MKKKIITWTIISAVIMLFIPWLCLTLIQGDWGMVACLFMFYILNPLYSIVVGAVAGENTEDLWSLPFIPGIMFLLSSFFLYSTGDVGFYMNTGIYVILGVVSMFISMLIRR